MKEHMAEGAEMMEQDEMESIMDHCAMECMHAIEAKDKDAFRQSFHVLISDIVHKMSEEMEKEA